MRSCVQVLETASCINAVTCCVHKTQSGQTLPRTLRKQELRAPGCPLVIFFEGNCFNIFLRETLGNLVLQDMRNGPPYPRPENFGGYNMAPPHLVPNPHNHGALPNEASMRPPSRVFGPPDPSGMFSPDAYRQHHEVTAMVRS
jgi:hypothetical protein